MDSIQVHGEGRATEKCHGAETVELGARQMR
jgi:hypothetical protein